MEASFCGEWEDGDINGRGVRLYVYDNGQVEIRFGKFTKEAAVDGYGGQIIIDDHTKDLEERKVTGKLGYWKAELETDKEETDKLIAAERALRVKE